MEHKVPLECTKGSIIFNLATWISEILLMTFVSMVMVSHILLIILVMMVGISHKFWMTLVVMLMTLVMMVQVS